MAPLREIEVLSRHEYWGNIKDENKTRATCSLKYIKDENKTRATCSSKGPQKTKTLVVVAAGGTVPAEVGNTRVIRNDEPAPTPAAPPGA